jgi:WD40 repeat protein/serine/threonine protein kinase
MPTPPAEDPRTVTQVPPPHDGPGPTPAFEIPSETVAASAEQQKVSAELSKKPNADLIADRYLLGEEIGRGGMGVVYYAKDVRLNREVAVKLLLDRYPADSVIASRFVEEARITAQLQHPGIAPVHDLGTLANGRPFLAMKLIKGKTLSKLLARRERKRPEDSSEDLTPPPPSLKGKGEQDTAPFPSGKEKDLSGSPFPSGKGVGGLGGFPFLDTFSEICQTVAFAHSKNVIHRDLKPANVMVGAFGEVQVMDWGLAKVLRNAEFGLRNEDGKAEEKYEPRSLIESNRTPDSETLAGSVMGTPAYMPPEQAKGEVAITNARSDVFALGAILCELLTGDPPYTGPFEEVRAHSVLGDIQPARARLAASAADPDLIALATDCLDPDPANRPADASEVVARLSAYRTGVADRLRQAEQDRAAAEVRVHEQIKRRRVWLALAALMVIGTATSVVFAVKSSVATEFARGETLRANDETVVAKKNFDEATKAHKEMEKQKARAEKQLTRAEWLVYANSIDDAQRHWKENRGDYAKQELTGCRLDYRGWEHDFHFTNLHRDSVQLARQNPGSVHVVCCPDGKRIITGGYDGIVRIRDINTGHTILELNGHTNVISALSLCAEGKRLVTGSWDNTARVWDIDTGKLIHTSTAHPKFVQSVAISSDGRRIFTGCADSIVRIWEVGKTSPLVELKNHWYGVDATAISPDGNYFVTGSNDNSLQFWDSKNGQNRGVLNTPSGSSIYSIAFSPDGKYIASGGSGKANCIWETKNGQLVSELKGQVSRITCLAFSPDGQQIVSGDYNSSIHIRNAKDGNIVNELKGHISSISSVAFSHDGRRIFSGGADGTVRVWSLSADPIPTEFKKHPDPVMSVAVGIDSNVVVSRSFDYSLLVWRADSGGILCENKYFGGISNVTLSRDGKHIFAGYGTGNDACVIDARSLKVVTTLKGHTKNVCSVAASPDGRHLVTGSWDNTLRYWDYRTGKSLVVFQGHSDWVTHVAFSPDGRHIVSGGRDKTLRQWDVNTGQCINVFHGHTHFVSGVAISLDGKYIASCCLDAKIRVWDATTGTPVAVLMGHSNEVNSIAFSPDSKRIASASSDKEIWLWNTSNWTSVAAIKGHSAPVNTLCFRSDGNGLISGSFDNTIRIWEASLSQPFTDLISGSAFFVGVALGNDGSRIYAHNKDNKKSAWLTATGQPAPDDEPIPDFEGKTEVFSPDGKYSARIVDGKVQLRDEAKWAKFDAEMKRRLKEWSQPNPAWHLTRADECAKDKNDFAERFHLRWVVKQVPTDFGSVIRLAAVEAKMAKSTPVKE